MNGHISEEALELYNILVAEKQGLDFSEGSTYDFARCMRPDGSYYGTRGKCRKGSEVGEKVVEPASREPATSSEKTEKKKGYKPKEGGSERKGLRGMKDKLFGGKKKDLDGLIQNSEQVARAHNRMIDKYKSMLAAARSKKEKKRIASKIEEAESRKKLEIGRISTTNKFVSDLKKNLPKNAKAHYDEFGELLIEMKVGRHKINTSFSGGEGFNYSVNGTYNMGTVKSKKDQIRVALAVKNIYDGLANSLPEGTVIKTSAYEGDGNGKAREKAYMRIGFGAPDSSGFMWSKKSGDRMVPSSSSESEEAYNNPGTVYFREGETQSVKNWLEVITGKPLKA